jgi:uncharacterized OsmC-like protein
MAHQLMRAGALTLALAGVAACSGAPAESAAQTTRVTDSPRSAPIAASRRTAITDAVAKV